MASRRALFWHSVQPLIGSVIGVGIFGLPFVFAQAGFLVGLLYLVILGLANTVLLLMYGDIIKNTDGHARISGVVRMYLGHHWSWFATVVLFAASWGAMIAYIILGGGFLHALLGPIFGGTITMYQVIFFIVSGTLMVGGLGFIARIESVFVVLLLGMLFFILFGSVPHVALNNLLYVNADHWFLPFGVVLFAFGGLAAVPEMSHILGRYRAQDLNKSIVVGTVTVALVYALFAGVVTGVTGSNTTEDAITGVGAVVGNWALILGSMIGIVSVFTSFLILGISIMNGLTYDFKQRHLVSWGIAAGVPFVLFLAGARSFIHVIGFTGGVLGSLIAIIVIYMYIRAKNHVCTPKRCLMIPNYVLFLCSLVFGFGLIMTLAGVV